MSSFNEKDKMKSYLFFDEIFNFLRRIFNIVWVVVHFVVKFAQRKYKDFFDFVANIFRFSNEIWLILEIMFKTIIKLEICEKCNKQIFKFKKTNEIFMKLMSLNFLFAFKYFVFVFEHRNWAKNDKDIIIFDENFLTQIRKRDNQSSQIKNK